MNKTKKQTEDIEPTQQEKCQSGLIKCLIENLPDLVIDRIHVVTRVLEIQFTALSFEHASLEILEKKGKKQINSIHDELQIFIDTIHEDLMKIWKEDKEYRKAIDFAHDELQKDKEYRKAKGE